MLDLERKEGGHGQKGIYTGHRHPEMANRVIFTTGDVICGEITQFIEQIGAPFLPKPFTPDEL